MDTCGFGEDHKEPEQKQSNYHKQYDQKEEGEVQDQRRDHHYNGDDQGCYIQIVMAEYSPAAVCEVLKVSLFCDFLGYYVQAGCANRVFHPVINAVGADDERHENVHLYQGKCEIQKTEQVAYG